MVVFSGKSRARPGVVSRRSKSDKARVIPTFMPRPLLPAHLDVEMKYTDNRIMQPGAAGVVNAYQYRTSTFDPDFTGGGHQPYLRDQIVAMGYAYYSVYWMGVKIRAAANAGSASASMLVGLRPDTDGASDSGSDWSVLAEKAAPINMKWGINTLARPLTLSDSRYVGDVAGIGRDVVLEQYQFIAGSGGNPVNCVYWNVNVQDTDHVTTSSAVNLNLELTFKVRWFLPAAVSQS